MHSLPYCCSPAPPALPSPKKPHRVQLFGLCPSYRPALLASPQHCIFHAPGSNLIPKNACAQHLLNPQSPSAGQPKAASCCAAASPSLLTGGQPTLGDWGIRSGTGGSMSGDMHPEDKAVMLAGHQRDGQPWGHRPTLWL